MGFDPGLIDWDLGIRGLGSGCPGTGFWVSGDWDLGPETGIWVSGTGIQVRGLYGRDWRALEASGEKPGL